MMNSLLHLLEKETVFNKNRLETDISTIIFMTNCGKYTI